MARPTILRRSIALLLASSLVLGSAPVVLAQSAEDVAAARSLAAEGVKLYDAKNYEEALDKFKRAESLYHAPPHLLYMARCQAQLGKLVAARETYLKIIKENLAPDAPKAFAQAKVDAANEAKALEPRIASLEIKIKNPPSSGTVSVTIDGNPLNAALIGVARPTDPGTHKIEAKAGDQSASAEVTLAEGAKETVELELKAGGSATPPGGGDTGSGTGSGGGDDNKDTGTVTVTPTTDSGANIPAFVLLGVGVVGLGVGTVFMLQASSKQKDADALCPNGRCPESRRNEISDLDNQAKSARTIGFIGLGVGVAAVGAGLVLLVLGGGSSSEKKASSSGVTVQPYATLGGFGLQGSF